MNVRFCVSCHSLILADFSFCPYCGVATGKGPTLDEAVTGSFRRLSGDDGGRGTEGPSNDGPFSRAERGLDRLEAEMDLLLEELAREGRSSK